MAPGDSGESLNLSPEERHVYGQLFRQADPDNVGIVMGEAAVKFFEKTRLNARILGEVWQIADRENRGFLTPAGFSVALRLIGHAQAGKEPTATLALSQGPIPQFEGVTTTPLNPQPTGALSPQGTGAGAPPLSAQGTGATRVPPLPLERAAQYARVFQDQTHGDTVLSGEASKRIFEKSGLSVDVLGRIWQLADTEQRGALVQTEFIIAMHLLTSIKAGTLRSLPTILPAGLYDAATRGSAAAAAGGSSVAPAPGAPGPSSPGSGQRSPLGASFGAGGIAPPPVVARHTTGMRPPPPNFPTSPMARAAPPPPPPPAHTHAPAPAHAPAPVPAGGPEWLITPAEKARMNTVFQDLDKAKKGVLTGEQAVPFLQRSGLDDNILAQIWDLADVKSEGQLTSDTFAVALYLIQQQRQTGGPLPDKLPPNLIPPSMRTAQQQRPISPPVAVPVAVPPPHVKSAMDDLFGLDSGPSSTTSSLPALTATHTGTGAGAGAPVPSDPLPSSTSPAQPSSPTRPPNNNTSTFKPFVPSSAFGRTLTAQVTGDSNKSTPSAASQIKAVPTPPQTFGISTPPAPVQQHAAAQNDLLGGDDGEASRSLSNDTAELANLSNQIGSLSKHMQETSANRSNLQNELSQTSVQKKNFEQRLAQLRALYEKEARDVRALEEQLKTSKAETTKLQAEVATIEASYYDLQSQHQTMTAALHADQQENASLKERLRVVSAEVSQIKPQIEKLKSEARQQKGIVAINRKQLSLGESERDKLKAEAEDLTRQNQDLARQIQNASVVSSAGSAAAGSAAASPSVNSASGTNPFFRRTGSSDIMGVFSTPSPSSTPAPPKSYADRSFDDVFGPGPSAASPAPSASPVPAAVKPQFTGASTASSTFSAVTAPTSEGAAPAISRHAAFPPETAAPASSEAATEVPTVVGAFPTSGDVASPATSVTASSTTASPAPAAAAIYAAPPTAPETTPTRAVSSDKAAPLSAAAAGVATAVVGTNETASPAATAEEEKSVWGQGHGKNDSLSDPFSTLDDNKDKAKEDFESAFASFKAARAGESSGGDGFDDAFEVKTSASGSVATGTFAPMQSENTAGVGADKTFADFNTEFPPIAELNHEDSDSESDNGGFDDDFAPASPPSNKDHKTAPAAAEANSHSIAESVTPKAASPELAKSSPADTGIFNTRAAPSNMDDIFSAPAAAAAPTAPATAAASTATTSFDSTSFDDLDDFDGLEEAREGSGDEEFANISRSGLDDFQSAFNSSPAGKGMDSGFDFSSIGGGSTNKAAGDSSDWFSLGAGEHKPVAAPVASATPADAAAAADASRPPVSRNTTQETTTTDDPTLQRLTSMGYPRAHDHTLQSLNSTDIYTDIHRHTPTHPKMVAICALVAAIPLPLQAASAVVGAVFIGSKLLSLASFVLNVFLLSGTNLRQYGKKGTWAVVTGASDGLGKEFATQLASKGFNLVLVSRTQSKLDDLAAALKARFAGLETKVLAMDFAKNDDADYARLSALIQGLDIGVLINNVGQSHSIPVPFLQTASDELESIVTINCLGTLKTTKVVLPSLVARHKGLVLTMGSFGGWMPTPYLATYSGSKAFLQQWNASLAAEVKPHGVDAYLVLSYLVVSAMSKVRRSSMLVPKPDAFVRAALAKIGSGSGWQAVASTYTPFWSHALMQWAVENTIGVGHRISIWYNLKMHQDIRARALRKAARDAKKN